MDEVSGDLGGDVTQLLRQWSAGDRDVSDQLLLLTYGKLLALAGACMSRERAGHTMQPTAVVGELYVRLATGNSAGWKDREHFYSFAPVPCVGFSPIMPEPG